MPALIAFDTSTERVSVALAKDGVVFARDDVGGASASTTLLPAIFGVLGAAGLALAELDAIAFGRGPGAFTGLRTACAVAQGLAFGAAKPVLPIDSLLAVAEDARDGAAEASVWALLDARMDQIYAAEYAHAEGRWATRTPPFLTDCGALTLRWREAPPAIVAGNALVAFAGRLDTGGASRKPDAVPSACALLRLAERAWSDGEAVDAAQALPLYVRDKVAETESERAEHRARRGAGSEPGSASRTEASAAAQEPSSAVQPTPAAPART